MIESDIRNKTKFKKLLNSSLSAFSKFWKSYSYIVIFAVILIAYLIINGSATTWGGLMNILRHTATNVGIIAIGMGLVILTGEIDLSVGAAVALVASFSVEIFNSTGSIFVTLLFAIALGATTGFINGILVGKVKVPSFITTLGTSLIFRSIASFYLSEKGQPTFQINGDLASWSTFYKIGNNDFLTIPIAAIIFIVLLLVVVYITRMTKFGKQIYAVGSNEKAARLSGINVTFTRIAVFVIAGVLVGVAGFIQVSRSGSISPFTVGTGYDTDSIAAVVIGGISMAGGRGGIMGVGFGALSFMLIDKIIVSLGVNPLLNGIIRGGILLLAVILQLIQKKKE